ncbi:MAG: hypothetical protein E6Q77_08620 [Rhizobium sp.]|nr:MAG: hypothetical protein E6Q77_08620 [Rhizobium sp.]
MTAEEQKLAEAIEVREKAAALVDEKRRALERAMKIVDDADAVIARHKEAEQNSSDSQAKRLEEWIADGCKGKPPANPDEKNLQDMRAAAAKAEGEKVAASKAFDLVEQSFAEAQNALVDANAAVTTAARAVVAHEVEVMGQELAAIEARAVELRGRLTAVPERRSYSAGNDLISAAVCRLVDDPPAPADDEAMFHYGQDWLERIATLAELPFTRGKSHQEQMREIYVEASKRTREGMERQIADAHVQIAAVGGVRAVGRR